MDSYTRTVDEEISCWIYRRLALLSSSAVFIPDLSDGTRVSIQAGALPQDELSIPPVLGLGLHQGRELTADPAGDSQML